MVGPIRALLMLLLAVVVMMGNMVQAKVELEFAKLATEQIVFSTVGIKHEVSFQLGIIQVGFSAPIRPLRFSGKGQVEDHLQGRGLSRLLCNHTLIESYESKVHSRKNPNPVHLVPLDWFPQDSSNTTVWEARSALYRSLTILFGSNFSTSSALTPGKFNLSFAVVFGSSELQSLSSKNDDLPYKHAQRRPLLQVDELDTCRFILLPSKKQGVSPRGGYFAAEEDELLPLTGSVGVTVTSSSPFKNHEPRKIAAAMEILEAALVSSEQEDESESEGPHCKFDPRNIVLTETQAKSMTTARNVIAGVIKSILEPIMESVTDAVNDAVGGFVANEVSENAEPGISDNIHLEMTRSFGPQVIQRLTTNVAETMQDELSPALGELMGDYLKKTLNKLLVDTVDKQVSETISQRIADRVSLKAPFETAKKVSLSLGHTLVRSLTHSIVPSVLHSISHSPLVDYYCYYCYHTQEYCEYCVYSPNQVYYSLFYSGWFTSYYTDYYLSYFRDNLEIMNDQRMDQINRKEDIASTIEVTTEA